MVFPIPFDVSARVCGGLRSSVGIVNLFARLGCGTRAFHRLKTTLGANLCIVAALVDCCLKMFDKWQVNV